MTDALLTEIAARRDDLIRLTQELIRIPTLNPPGRDYRTICSFIAERMGQQGWEVEMIRAEGTPGDSRDYPRGMLSAATRG